MAGTGTPDDLSDDEVSRELREFLEDLYSEDLRRVVAMYPERRSLLVNFEALREFNERLSDMLLGSPERLIAAGEDVIQDIVGDMPEAKGRDIPLIHFRVENLPTSKDVRIEIRDLRAKHVGRLISVVGLVRRATEVRPRIITAVFQCIRCGENSPTIHVPQTESILSLPIECPKDDGGCGRSGSKTTFLLVKSECRTVDSQKIEVQELPEEMYTEAQPQRLQAVLEDDLTGLIWPGRRVVLNGILRAYPRSAGGSTKRTLMDLNLEVVSIESRDDLYRIKLTEKDIEEIREEANKGRVLQRVRSSIAPTLYGLDMEKTGLALQMFGGVSKTPDDITRIRGDIHILLVGDPSTGKSQLLSFIAKAAPRAIYASGKGTTAAGLTAAAVKDDLGDGRWTLEAGALVLADQGLAAVDEMDKMSDQDRSSMHEAMEQQRVSIAKAGINATLYTRCSVLGAANPKRGRFEENMPFADQVEMPLPLLQRFDAIFLVQDAPDEERDAALAEHVVMSHLLGELKRTHRKIPPRLNRKYTPPFDMMKLRKYVHYAKQYVHPVLTDAAAKKIERYYQRLRKESRSQGRGMLISPRHLEGIIRFSEASARCRLSEKVEKGDVDVALQLFESWLRVVAGEEGTGWDVDAIMTGMPRSLKEEMDAIRGIIGDMDEGEGVSFSEIEGLARTNYKISGERVRFVLDKLRESGEIYEPGIDRFRRVYH